MHRAAGRIDDARLRDAEPLNGTRRLTKLLREAGGQPWSAASSGRRRQLEREIEERAAQVGVTIDRAAMARLIALAGGDSGKLRADTERVLVFVGQGTVTAAHVEQVAERVEKSTDPWGLTNAIEAGDARTALRELRLRLERATTCSRCSGRLPGRFGSRTARMPEHRLRPAVDAMLRTDIALKSSGGNPRMLLERLVVELCGGGPAGPAEALLRLATRRRWRAGGPSRGATCNGRRCSCG